MHVAAILKVHVWLFLQKLPCVKWFYSLSSTQCCSSCIQLGKSMVTRYPAIPVNDVTMYIRQMWPGDKAPFLMFKIKFHMLIATFWRKPQVGTHLQPVPFFTGRRGGMKIIELIKDVSNIVHRKIWFKKWIKITFRNSQTLMMSNWCTDSIWGS